MRIAIALFDDAEELDIVGPYEVLAAWAVGHPEDGVRVVTVSETETPVTCAKGLQIVPHTTWLSAQHIDVLVYPGGQGTRRNLDPGDPVHRRLQNLMHEGTLMTSVCTGSLVYAAAGLLHNRPATTHWSALDLLRTLDASIDVRPDARFVDDVEVVTAAGVSAGIDMALHLVARLQSPERAREVRREIQYDPAPPV
jgi:transcriptional regulator GlxA family with amidase domain